MTAPPPESVEEQIQRISTDFFSPVVPQNPQNYQQNPQPIYPGSSSQNYQPNYPQTYQRRDQILDLNYQQPPQMTAPYYISNDPNMCIPQEAHQPIPPYAQEGTSSIAHQPIPSYAYGGTSSVASSQFTDTAPIGGTPSTGLLEIQEEDVPLSTEEVPQQPTGKKVKRWPEYNKPWLKYYDWTRDKEGTMQYLQCKVNKCNKTYVYKKRTV